MKRIPIWLSYLAVAGNLVYVLWIVRNGINEGLRATTVELVSMIGLILLLGLNSLLLWASRGDGRTPPS